MQASAGASRGSSRASTDIAVTLWIDDVASLARIAPRSILTRPISRTGGVRIRVRTPPRSRRRSRCPTSWSTASAAGCPTAMLAAMAEAPHPPVWIVLEYLSAEPWIDASHALPSPHPQLPLTRWFWFPGFTPQDRRRVARSGLLAARDAFRADAAARDDHVATRRATCRSRRRSTYRCSATPIRRCRRCSTLGRRRRAGRVHRARGRRAAPSSITGPAALCRMSARRSSRGRLTIAVAPFVDQDAFDRRLWVADLNFVRGEDSFVRAQWAGQPYVWHLYPQAEDAHLTKMDAFLNRIEGEPARRRADRRNARSGTRGTSGRPVATAEAWPAVSRVDAGIARSRRGPGRARWPGRRTWRPTGQVLRKSFIIMGFADPIGPPASVQARRPRCRGCQ